MRWLKIFALYIIHDEVLPTLKDEVIADAGKIAVAERREQRCFALELALRFGIEV